VEDVSYPQQAPAGRVVRSCSAAKTKAAGASYAALNVKELEFPKELKDFKPVAAVKPSKRWSLPAYVASGVWVATARV
jgi:hypothetical protein